MDRRASRHPEGRLYGAVLYLLPPAFRREFGDEMARDFAEARREASLVGRARDLWRFRARMALDLLAAAVVQWLHTGLPAFVLVAAIASAGTISALASFWPNLTWSLPAETPQADTIGLVLLVTVVLLVIVATIIFTLWWTRRFTRPLPRRRPRV